MRPWLGSGGVSISVGLEDMRMGFDQYAFGKRFKELRKNSKLTQEQLADRLGITDRHIRGIERGDFFPSIDLYVLIAESFEISLDMLILGAQPSAKEMQMKKRLQEQERIVQQQRESIEQAIYILCMIKNK